MPSCSDHKVVHDIFVVSFMVVLSFVVDCAVHVTRLLHGLLPTLLHRCIYNRSHTFRLGTERSGYQKPPTAMQRCEDIVDRQLHGKETPRLQ